MDITEVGYSDILQKNQYIENKRITENNTKSSQMIIKDDYQNSSNYKNGGKVILDNEDGVVIQSEQKNSSNLQTNDNNEINLQGYTKIQIERLYESGQITITQYELEMKKRGLDDSGNATDTNDTTITNIEDNTNKSEYNFDNVLNLAKQLIKESNNFNN